MLGAVVFLGGFMGAALFRAGGGSDFRRLSLYCYAVPFAVCFGKVVQTSWVKGASCRIRHG